MFFQWLKQYMPRRLVWRATLILILPVLVIQAVVSVIYLQRHFEEVTVQMTRAVVRDIALYLDPEITLTEIERAAMARKLDLEVATFATDHAYPPSNRAIYDISGIAIARVLHKELPDLLSLQLIGERDATLWLQRNGEIYAFSLDRRRLSAANSHQLVVNMIFFGVIVTLIAFFYLRNQLRPITRLAQAAEAFGRGQHIAYRPSGAIEVRAAGAAFLDMRARIERHIEQRTLMLSGVSHDLRTPLTRLKLGLSLLNEDEKKYDLMRDVDEMEALLRAFLDFTKGTSESDPAQEIDPQEFIAKIVDDAQRAHLNVEFEICGNTTMVNLQPIALRRAIDNLLSNAVRYGSRAEISLKQSESMLTIMIDDDGPGIPSERRHEALRPFTRLDPARNQNKGSGVGLGLTIAADIARAQGGQLRLEQSEKLGGLRAVLTVAI